MISRYMTTLIAIADQTDLARDRRSTRHAGRRARVWATVVMVVASALMLFAHLGTYAPWDDEAITAMTSRALWRTGDTSIRVDDHNLIAYRNGLLVHGDKDRFTPPLQFFLLAPVIGLFGDGNWAIRLPFAIYGAITVAIGLRWLWRAVPPSPLLWWGAAAIVLTNVEFFLFSRTCRYYGLAMMLTAATAYLYCHRTGRTRGVWGLSIVMAGLLTSQYLDYAAVVGCLVVDYVVWGRHQRRFTLPQWAILILPQLVVAAVVCPIWNPIARQAEAGPDGYPHHWLHDHLWLMFLNVRDLVASDFVVLPLVLAAPLLWFKRRSPALLRAPAAIAVFITVISFLVATTAQEAQTAEVRYLAPLLPICLATAIIALRGTLALRPRPRALLLGVSALTVMVGPGIGNANVDGLFGVHLTSDPLAFYWELIHPQAEPYTPTIAWINAHVPAGASVFVAPDYMVYPLMFRAPGPTYAWQLNDPPKADLADAPPIHIHGRLPPDYLIKFGNNQAAQAITRAQTDLAKRGVRYELVATLPYYWHDMYRPERVWRSFTTVRAETGWEVYIYRRVAVGSHAAEPVPGPHQAAAKVK
jgi:hypothetical protein